MAKAAKAANATRVHLIWERDPTQVRFNDDGTVTARMIIRTDSDFGHEPEITVGGQATPAQIKDAMYDAAKTLLENSEVGTVMIPKNKCWFYNIPA